MSGTLVLPLPVGDATTEPGSRVAVDAVDVIEVSEGLVTAKHTYLDSLAMLRQLGLA